MELELWAETSAAISASRRSGSDAARSPLYRVDRQSLPLGLPARSAGQLGV